MKFLYMYVLTGLLAIGVHSSFAQCTFNNPVKAAESADPDVYFKDGYYYYLVTTGDGVWIRKSNQLQNIGSAPATKVWSWSNGITGNVWAPELHYLNGKWYIYSCGSITSGCCTQRMFVLEGNTQDALGTYTFKTLWSDIPAIDETVWQDPSTGKIYMAWSQWDSEQSIFICQMTDPITMGATKVKLSAPTNSWERIGWPVNEGPYFIKRNNTLHIVFSVSGCSTPDYALALLTCTNGNYLNASSWKKSTSPVFKRSDANGVYGPGHCSFTQSPDGCEDWIVYHAKSSTDNTNSDRSTRIQKFIWDANDYPVFDMPVSTATKVTCPSTTGSCSTTQCTDLQTSYKTFNIPCTIEAEDFDNGCPDDAYHDADAVNNGGQYRQTGVDIQTTSDAGGGYNIGWLDTGEWLEYTVNVAKAGDYLLEARVASSTDNNQFHVEFNNIDKTGLITVNTTGGLQTWSTLSKTVALSAGKQIMKLFIDKGNGGFNINKMIISSSTSVNEHSADNTFITLFPNPSKDKLKIVSPHGTMDEIRITDFAGRILYENNSSVGNTFEISIGNLQKGMYLIYVYCQGNRICKKFFVQ